MAKEIIVVVEEVGKKRFLCRVPNSFPDSAKFLNYILTPVAFQNFREKVLKKLEIFLKRPEILAKPKFQIRLRKIANLTEKRALDFRLEFGQLNIDSQDSQNIEASINEMITGARKIKKLIRRMQKKKKGAEKAAIG